MTTSKKNMKPRLFRYIRPTELDLLSFQVVTLPTGGITFLFEIDQDNAELAFVPVICRDDENFNFTISRHIAEGRFDKGDYEVINYDRNVSLVQNVIDALEEAKNLDDREQTLKSKLKTIISSNQLNQDLYDNIVKQIQSRHSEVQEFYPAFNNLYDEKEAWVLDG